MKQKSIYQKSNNILIGSEDLSYLLKFIEDHFETVNFVGFCDDNSKIEFSTSDEVINYENPRFKKLMGISIISNEDENTSLQLILGKIKPKDEILTEYDLSYDDLNFGLPFEQELIKRLKTLKPWYWFFNYIPFKYILPLVLVIFNWFYIFKNIIQKILGEYSSSQTSTVQFSWFEGVIINIVLLSILYGVGYLIDKFKIYLFPMYFFKIGQQLNVYKVKQRLQYTIFIVIILGIIINVIANKLAA